MMKLYPTEGEAPLDHAALLAECDKHLSCLPPHVSARHSAQLLTRAVAVIRRLVAENERWRKLTRAAPLIPDPRRLSPERLAEIREFVAWYESDEERERRRDFDGMRRVAWMLAHIDALEESEQELRNVESAVRDELLRGEPIL